MNTLLLLTLHQLRREEGCLSALYRELRCFLEQYYRVVCPGAANPAALAERSMARMNADWSAYRRECENALPRWYRRLALQCHPDVGRRNARAGLFLEAAEAYRRRDGWKIRELCSETDLPAEWLEQLGEEALFGLKRVREMREALEASAEYRLLQRDAQARQAGVNLASLVAERLRAASRMPA